MCLCSVQLLIGMDVAVRKPTLNASSSNKNFWMQRD